MERRGDPFAPGNPTAPARPAVALGPVILATDGSPTARMAAMVAAAIVRATGDPLHVAHGWHASLVEDLEDIAAAVRALPSHDGEEDRAQDVLGQASTDLEEAGVEVAGVHLLPGPDAHVVAELAHELDAGLVVIGARGLSRFQRLLHTAAVESAVEQTLRPILVVRSGRWPPDRVLVGDDGSAPSRAAAERASLLARALGVDLAPVRASDGTAARDLVRAAGAGALLAVGNRGHASAPDNGLGSVCQEVLETAAGPVLVCHAARHEGRAG